MDNTEIFWRGQGLGQQWDQSQQISYTTNLRALMPYAPGHVRAVTDGVDIDFAWERRNRTGGQMRNSSGTVPMSESAELYDFEIYTDSTFTTIATTTSGVQAGLTTADATYTAADMLTDLGAGTPAAAGPYLYVRVYQVSTEVDRGFTYDHVVELDESDLL